MLYGSNDSLDDGNLSRRELIDISLTAAGLTVSYYPDAISFVWNVGSGFYLEP
jgi:hypothetical protein